MGISTGLCQLDALAKDFISTASDEKKQRQFGIFFLLGHLLLRGIRRATIVPRTMSMLGVETTVQGETVL